MKPAKRSFAIAGHRTSISLEPQFWQALRELARAQNVSLAQLVTDIDTARGDTNLSSAIRVYILEHYRQTAANPGKPHET